MVRKMYAVRVQFDQRGSLGLFLPLPAAYSYMCIIWYTHEQQPSSIYVYMLLVLHDLILLTLLHHPFFLSSSSCSLHTINIRHVLSLCSADSSGVRSGSTDTHCNAH